MEHLLEVRSARKSFGGLTELDGIDLTVSTGELLTPLRSQCSLVIVEHDLDFIKSKCYRITVLFNGQVLGEGSPDAIEQSDAVKKVYTGHV